MKTLDRETLKEMVHGVVHTQPHEIGCDECFDEVDRFAEAMLVGKDLDRALELVQDHLARCRFCREEFEALMDALRASK